MFNRARAEKFLSWAHSTFGPCALSREERAMRFVEEAIELGQAENVSAGVVHKIVDRVYARERGSTAKEVGQAQATLETLCANAGYDPDREAEVEWERVQAKPPEHWKDRHDAKTALGITTDGAA